MNYHAIYERLIERAKLRVYAEDVYTERHHIVPRCMGGTNAKANLVRLLPEEHLFAHRLLCRIYPHDKGLAYAVVMFAGSNQGKSRQALIAADRRRHAEANRGRKHSSDVKRKIGDANRNPPHQKRQKIGDAHRGKLVSIETREKISEANRNRSPEVQQRIGEAASLRSKGSTHTPEARQKMRDAARRRAERELSVL